MEEQLQRFQEIAERDGVQAAITCSKNEESNNNAGMGDDKKKN